MESDETSVTTQTRQTCSEKEGDPTHNNSYACDADNYNQNETSNTMENTQNSNKQFTNTFEKPKNSSFSTFNDQYTAVFRPFTLTKTTTKIVNNLLPASQKKNKCNNAKISKDENKLFNSFFKSKFSEKSFKIKETKSSKFDSKPETSASLTYSSCSTTTLSSTLKNRSKNFTKTSISGPKTSSSELIETINITTKSPTELRNESESSSKNSLVDTHFLTILPTTATLSNSTSSPLSSSTLVATPPKKTTETECFNDKTLQKIPLSIFQPSPPRSVKSPSFSLSSKTHVSSFSPFSSPSVISPLYTFSSSSFFASSLPSSLSTSLSSFPTSSFFPLFSYSSCVFSSLSSVNSPVTNSSFSTIISFSSFSPLSFSKIFSPKFNDFQQIPTKPLQSPMESNKETNSSYIFDTDFIDCISDNSRAQNQYNQPENTTEIKSSNIPNKQNQNDKTEVVHDKELNTTQKIECNSLIQSAPTSQIPNCSISQKGACTSLVPTGSISSLSNNVNSHHGTQVTSCKPIFKLIKGGSFKPKKKRKIKKAKKQCIASMDLKSVKDNSKINSNINLDVLSTLKMNFPNGPVLIPTPFSSSFINTNLNKILTSMSQSIFNSSTKNILPNLTYMKSQVCNSVQKVTEPIFVDLTTSTYCDSQTTNTVYNNTKPTFIPSTPVSSVLLSNTIAEGATFSKSFLLPKISEKTSEACLPSMFPSSTFNSYRSFNVSNNTSNAITTTCNNNNVEITNNKIDKTSINCTTTANQEINFDNIRKRSNNNSFVNTFNNSTINDIIDITHNNYSITKKASTTSSANDTFKNVTTPSTYYVGSYTDFNKYNKTPKEKVKKTKTNERKKYKTHKSTMMHHNNLLKTNFQHEQLTKEKIPTSQISEATMSKHQFIPQLASLSYSQSLPQDPIEQNQDLPLTTSFQLPFQNQNSFVKSSHLNKSIDTFLDNSANVYQHLLDCTNIDSGGFNPFLLAQSLSLLNQNYSLKSKNSKNESSNNFTKKDNCENNSITIFNGSKDNKNNTYSNIQQTLFNVALMNLVSKQLQLYQDMLQKKSEVLKTIGNEKNNFYANTLLNENENGENLINSLKNLNFTNNNVDSCSLNKNTASTFTSISSNCADQNETHTKHGTSLSEIKTNSIPTEKNDKLGNTDSNTNESQTVGLAYPELPLNCPKAQTSINSNEDNVVSSIDKTSPHDFKDFHQDPSKTNSVETSGKATNDKTTVSKIFNYIQKLSNSSENGKISSSPSSNNSNITSTENFSNHFAIIKNLPISSFLCQSSTVTNSTTNSVTSSILSKPSCTFTNQHTLQQQSLKQLQLCHQKYLLQKQKQIFQQREFMQRKLQTDKNLKLQNSVINPPIQTTEQQKPKKPTYTTMSANNVITIPSSPLSPLSPSDSLKGESSKVATLDLNDNGNSFLMNTSKQTFFCPNVENETNLETNTECVNHFSFHNVIPPNVLLTKSSVHKNELSKFRNNPMLLESNINEHRHKDPQNCGSRSKDTFHSNQDPKNHLKRPLISIPNLYESRKKKGSFSKNRCDYNGVEGCNTLQNQNNNDVSNKNEIQITTHKHKNIININGDNITKKHLDSELLNLKAKNFLESLSLLNSSKNFTAPEKLTFKTTNYKLQQTSTISLHKSKNMHEVLYFPSNSPLHMPQLFNQQDHVLNLHSYYNTNNIIEDTRRLLTSEINKAKVKLKSARINALKGMLKCSLKNKELNDKENHHSSNIETDVLTQFHKYSNQSLEVNCNSEDVLKQNLHSVREYDLQESFHGNDKELDKRNENGIDETSLNMNEEKSSGSYEVGERHRNGKFNLNKQLHDIFPDLYHYDYENDFNNITFSNEEIKITEKEPEFIINKENYGAKVSCNKVKSPHVIRRESKSIPRDETDYNGDHESDYEVNDKKNAGNSSEKDREKQKLLKNYTQKKSKFELKNFHKNKNFVKRKQKKLKRLKARFKKFESTRKQLLNGEEVDDDTDYQVCRDEEDFETEFKEKFSELMFLFKKKLNRRSVI